MIESGYDAADLEKGLYVTSIFKSFNGESTTLGQGSFCVFIRLAGCSVRCPWCDTKETWKIKSGRKMTVSEILSEVAKWRYPRRVTITGGEPLEQWGPSFKSLLAKLSVGGYFVSIETSGEVDLQEFLVRRRSKVLMRVSVVVDYKLIAGFEAVSKLTIPEQFCSLLPVDTVKFVIGSQADLEEAFRIAAVMRGSYSTRGRPPPKLVIGKVVEEGSFVSDEEFVNKLLAMGAESVFDGFNYQIHKSVFDVVKESEDGQFKPSTDR